MRPVLAWLVGALVVVLIGARLSFALLGGSDLASEEPTFLLDAALMAVTVLVAIFLGIQAFIYAPWYGLTERIRGVTPSATVLSSAIETDQFRFFHSNGSQQAVGPWPFHAAIALRQDFLEVWRRSGGQDKKLAEVRSSDLAISVVLVSSPIGVFPALEVATTSGSLRLYPMKVSRWWSAKRLTKVELEELVLNLPRS